MLAPLFVLTGIVVYPPCVAHCNPSGYVAAHCRILYAKDDRKESQKRKWAENAVNCASHLRPGKKIFFASDSRNGTYYAHQYGSKVGGFVATRMPNPNPPLHIDKVPHWKKRPVSDYFDAFVDLYMLGSADCVTVSSLVPPISPSVRFSSQVIRNTQYNKGGYGVFGLLISRNATCGVRQDAMDQPIIRHPCHWISGRKDGAKNRAPESSISPEPIYLPAMEG